MMKYQVEIKNVEAMRVAYTKYKGEVKRANKVFPSVFKAIREIYIKGPGMMFKGNPEKYITEILYPIEEA